MSKIHGQATIRIKGQVIETEDDATLMPGGKKNTGRMIGQKYNYSQTVIPAQVVCTIGKDASTSLRELQEMAEVEIIFETDVGTTYIIRNATQDGELSLSGGEGNGTVECTFVGAPAEEIMGNA